MSEEMPGDADHQLALELHNLLNRSQEDEDADLQFARNLQTQLNNDSDLDSSLQFVYPGAQQPEAGRAKSRPKENRNPNESHKSKALTHASLPANDDDDYLNQTQHLVHPGWELADPNPDVHSMFTRFDGKFFQNRLGCVILEWSSRMYSCAGICYQRSSRLGKSVTIRLSEPLLRLRPRKDLVETLLHEMIHAYFFILNVREGNGGHGPNFKHKMMMINKVAGTNITVYHSFHDEVAAYRTHIWRCTGICQNHTPFHGYVKRTSNRAPGPNDQWWAKHQRECSGTFMKISEPPKVTKKAPAKKAPPKKALPPVATNQGKDIRQWFKKPATESAVPERPSLGPSKSLPDRTTTPSSAFTTPRSKPKKPSGANIMSFGDLSRNSDGEESPPKPIPSFKDSEKGYTMATTGTSGRARDIREIRQKRFGQQQPPAQAAQPSRTDQTQGEAAEPKPKKPRHSSSDNEIEHWESYDEDVLFKVASPVMISLVDSSSDEEQADPPRTGVPPEGKPSSRRGAMKRRRDSDDIQVVADDQEQDGEEYEAPPSLSQPMSSQERSQKIKREVLEDESMGDDEIIFIDDEYNDDEAEEDDRLASRNPTDLAEETALLRDFTTHNSVMPSCSTRPNDEENDIVSCPICGDKIKRSELCNHLDGCSITERVAPPSFKRGVPKTKSTSSPGGRKRESSSSSSAKATRESLRNFGYTESEILALDLSTSSSSSMPDSEDELTPRQRRQRNLFKPTVGCPKCGQELMGHQLEAHRYMCPNKRGK